MNNYNIERINIKSQQFSIQKISLFLFVFFQTHLNQLFILLQDINSMTTSNQLKQGTVLTFQVLQNTVTYQLRVSLTAKGLWLCIEESGQIWKLTVSHEMVEQTVTKASGGKQAMTLKDFSSFLLAAISKNSERWGVGIMTPIELQVLRGGSATKQASNSKIYLILSDKQKKFHYPFTFSMNELSQKDKLIEAIKTMKNQLEELKVERADKSQSSFSIMSQTMNNGEQLKQQNQELKRKIKLYEDSLTQKRGAVEIDVILKEKNNLQLQAETKKRQQNRQITRLKNIHQMIDRQINQVRNQVETINKELLLLEDSIGGSAKLKSHAMKVLKSYQNQLRTQKKVLQKQAKQLQTVKRNIQNSKNNQRKVLAKIKQIQTEIDQSKKKANIKQISNRLHSVGKNSSNGSSSKQQSVGGSSQGVKPASQTSSKGNIVRDNLLKRNVNVPTSSQNRNHLLRTSPNITSNPKPSNQKMQGRAINSSYQPPKTNNNPRLFNTQKYRSGSKSDNQNSSVRSGSGQKKQFSKEDKEKQKRAIERLTGASNKVNIPPKVPSIDKNKRGDSYGKVDVRKPGSNSLTKPGDKKDSAKQMLNRMKQIKAHYNNKNNKVTTTGSKNLINKITELTQKPQ